MAKEKNIPNSAKFALGGISGMSAVCFTHPLELIKNRMQMSGEMGATRQYKTSFHALYSIVRKEGILAVYRGLSASLLRQAVYGTTRLGTYTVLLEKFSPEGRRPSYLIKALIGVVAGVAAGAVSLPTDVTMVRMTLDGRLPVEKRRNYGNVATALYSIVRDEGIKTLWRGSAPTISRAVATGAAMLATYSQVKQTLLESGYFRDNLLMHFTASLFSGFATAVITVPIDIAKTRLQDMHTAPDGTRMYKHMLDVWLKVVRYEGLFSLWKGFGPTCVRLAPQTILMFIFLEKYSRAYAKYVMKQDLDHGVM